MPFTSQDNLSSTVRVLNTVTDIDGKVVADHTIYTPSGVSAVITGIMVHLTNGVSVSASVTGSVGTESPTYANVIGDTYCENMFLTNQYTIFPLMNGFGLAQAGTIVPSGTALKFRISTGATATTATLSVTTIGYTI